MGKASRLKRERLEAARLEHEVATSSLAPLVDSGRGFERKIAWAAHHLDLFETARDRWLEGDAYTVTDELDKASGEHRLWIELGDSPAPDLGLLIGDCVHNLRSALDHLAYDLACAHARGPLSERVASRSEFPVFWSRAPRARELKDRIGCIDPAAQKIIEGLQPHSCPNGYRTSDLWILDQLWNIDKHRGVTVTLLATVGHAIGRPGEYIDRLNIIWSRGGPFRGRTEVMRYAIGPNSVVDMKRVPQVDVAFGYGMPAEGMSVGGTLRRLTHWARTDVVDPLLPFL